MTKGNKIPVTIFLVINFVNFSCGPKELTYDQYIEFMNDPKNGYLVESADDDLTVRIQYVPAEILFYNSLSHETKSFNKVRDSLVNKLFSFHYFKVSISQGGKSLEEFYAKNPSNYQEVVRYLSLAVKDDFSFSDNTYSLSLFDASHFPSFGIASSSQILLVFKSETPISCNQLPNLVFNTHFFKKNVFEFNFRMQKKPTLVKL